MTRPAASSTNTKFLVAPPEPDSCCASIPESDEKTGASVRDRPLVLLISKSASGLAGQIGLLSKGTISGSATSLAGAGAAAAPPVGTGATLLVVSDWGSALRVASAKDGRADATDSKPCLEIGCQGNSFGAWLETVCAGEVGTSGMYSSRVASAASGFNGSASNSKPEALAVGIGTCWDGPDGVTDGAEVHGC